ncbi:MAG: GNAT family N-acetyltransferase, partial [Candidatus Dormibacteria bacterium]
MNVRSASFRDIHRIEELYRDCLARDCQGSELSSDCPVPQATLMRLWSAVSKTISSLMPLGDSGDTLYVAEDGQEGIIGFIQAQAAPSKPKGWQILNLCVAPTGPGHFAGERLVTHLCNRGLEHGVTRFYVRLPLDHPLISVFQAQGFTQFATEQILYHDDPRPAQPHSALLRPARRDDVAAIYLLYLRITPSHVASLEGPSLKAWQAAFAGGMLARVGRDEMRHHVADLPGVTAWAAVRPASSTRPTSLTLMCEGQDGDLREAFIDAALGELPGGPVSCVLRHYD